ncbi:MAG TPA: hypothetical protein VFL94_11390 [Actinomycetales bacterium]|nr:hypothetical protein [Actinomycetales bacterium]
MAWLNRRRSDAAESAAAARGRLREGADHLRDEITDDEDSPDALRDAMTQLDRFVNAHAGQLPAAAVVGARQITDLLRDVVATSDVRPLDVYAVVQVKGIVTDYLPTTLRTYLAVDRSLLDRPRSSGRTPRESLLEQLDALRTSAVATLEATNHEDADALMTQGSFLRTKFTRSDLDL